MTSFRIAAIVVLLGASFNVAFVCIDPLGSSAGAAVTCIDGKAPGWLNPAGEATSCVDDGSTVDLGPAKISNTEVNQLGSPQDSAPAAAPLLTREPKPQPQPSISQKPAATPVIPSHGRVGCP
ncbi:MAG: hypothetical protein H7248_09815 [Microbacteriaceae bacterium]|nr:hypothetical protein [Microbacteriaceae bacterium]